MPYLPPGFTPLWVQPSYRARLDRFRAERLRELVRHAAARVPYYRARFAAAGVDARGFCGLPDLERLPVSRKGDLQPLRPEEICAEGMDLARLVVHETGGSTGQPLMVRRTVLEDRCLHWLRWRALHALGLRPTDRSARIASISTPPAGMRRRRPRLAWLLGLNRFRAFHCMLQPAQLRAAVAAYAPDVLYGYPEAMVRMALCEPAAGVPPLRPRLAICAGELLTAQARRVLEDAFGAPVRDAYGAHEFNLLAWECARTGLSHVCDEGVILEVLDDEGRPVRPGETGEVVATALHSFAMPIIRYALGDVATRGPDSCPCGHLLPTLRVVRGRNLDYFRLPGERWLHPYEVIELLYGPGMEWVAQYQLVQEGESELRLMIRPRAPVGEERLRALVACVRGALGPDVNATVELVADIPPEPNGKCRVAYSRIAP